MAEAIKQPKTKGVAKVPVIMQLEALECGAACLTMILAYYQKWVPLEQVRADCGVSRDGSNAKNILYAARYYGLNAKGYRFEPEALKESGSFPCIIHWDFNHFVVLCGFRNNKVYLNDPARGEITVSMEQFDKSFTGICLMFSPSERFEPGGKRKSMMGFIRKSLRGTRAAVIFTLSTAVIGELTGLIAPGFQRVLVDRLLTGQNPEWLKSFLLLFAVFCGIQIIMSAVQSIYSLRINGKMAAVGNSTYMWKILNLPLDFFSQRMSGDIEARQASNAGVANSLINTFAPLLLQTFMMIFYLVVMIRYSMVLTLLGIISLLINAWISDIITRKSMSISRVAMRESAKLSTATVAGIDMVETIKSNGAEDAYFERWAGYQAALNSLNVKNSVVSRKLSAVAGIFSELINNMILFGGVYLVIKGKFTAGMVMAFQGFLSSFMSPALSLVNTGETIRQMRTSMERIEDVMEYPDDNVFAASEAVPEDEYQKLSGNISVKDLTFGYSPLAKPVIKNFSMELQPGKTVAVVGRSGCGKSTVAKLISGLYRPWSGEILFDGVPLHEIDKTRFCSSLAVVDQDVIIFEDTISNNIKMWDQSIEDFEMILAARDAQIHNKIVERPGGYEYRLSEHGKDMSGGERQRLEIARVLAQDPTVIILDEATSALDAATEYEVIKAIADRGIACIVIAHRLSTIRTCDEIIILEDGEIRDRGTHSELYARCPLYKDLVSNE